jgi:succinyl-diaminopimelate desuccinylase
MLQAAVAEADEVYRSPRAGELEQVGESWPPFRLPPGHPLVRALTAGAKSAGLDLAPVVAGPSNIGCLLSARGIASTAGFGVRYRGLHATDEAIDLSSIPAVQAAYHRAVLELQD